MVLIESSKIKFLLKFGLTCILLVFLGYKIDWEHLKTTFLNVRAFPFAASYTFHLLCSIPLAIRLRILLRPTVLRFSLTRLIAIQFISLFYSLFLPSGIGLAVVRWYKITENRVGRRVFVVITLIERMMLILFLLLCTLLPLLLTRYEKAHDLLSPTLPAMLLILTGCLIFFYCLFNRSVYRKISAIMKWLQTHMTKNIFGKILGVYEDFGLYHDRRSIIIMAFFFHLLYASLNFVRLYFVFLALDVDLPIVTIFWVSAIMLLILTLPLSLGGLGIRESGFALLLSLYGIQPEVGVMLGGLLSVHVLMNAGIGAFFALFEKGSSQKVVTNDELRSTGIGEGIDSPKIQSRKAADNETG